jgi:hypothetical protein
LPTPFSSDSVGKWRIVRAATRKYVTVLTIQCDTSRFVAGNRNGFKCTICRDFFPFPVHTTNVMIVALSVGLTTVRDAATWAVLHDCRQTQAKPLVTDLGAILREGDLL